MLTALLTEIRNSNSLQASVLAARLSLSTRMVEAMLADLERMGILRQVDTSCGEPCGGCPLASGCGSTGSQGRLWVVARQAGG